MKTFFHLRFSKFMLILIMLIGFTTLNAQSTRPASFDQQTKIVQLDESIPFGFQYDIDISELNLGSKSNVEKYFAELETDLVTYEVTSAKQVKIQLNARAHPKWSAADWNEYFRSLQNK